MKARLNYGAVSPDTLKAMSSLQSYADTCGFHGDNAFPAWPYRDYVLK
ncbi:MAG: hypothetical protein HUU37_02645, partial [Bdellovibrionales bacterium]|nr:hypothetical protein [Bdellovibrionales bacterium]